MAEVLTTVLLLYEDEVTRRDHLVTALTDETLEVVAPATWAETYRVFQKDPTAFGLVVVDHHFLHPGNLHPLAIPKDVAPVFNGLSLCRELSRVNPKVPIILYGTREEDLPDKKAALSVGVYRVVTASEMPELVRRLRKPIRELTIIAQTLDAVAESRQAMSHVMARLGVGFQVVDKTGYIWFRDEEFRAITGESGRPYRLCYCRSHGYSFEHGMCKNCIVVRAASTGKDEFQRFFSPVYPAGAESDPEFRYLSVQATPIRNHSDSGLSDAADECFAVIEAISRISRESADIQSMGILDHLNLLRRSLEDLGFSRVRMYRAAKTLPGSTASDLLRGLLFHGKVSDGTDASSVQVRLSREPALDASEIESCRLAKWVKPQDYLVLDETQRNVEDALFNYPEHPQLDVALFDPQAKFIGWVSLDRCTVDEAGRHIGCEIVTPDDWRPQPEENCVPPSPVPILEEIARVVALKEIGRSGPLGQMLEAERTFQRIRMKTGTKLESRPLQLLRRVLDVVRNEVGDLCMAHVRHIQANAAVLVAFVGEYGDVSEPTFDIRRSQRGSAIVARSGLPRIFGNITKEQPLPGPEEFAEEAKSALFQYPSHAVYPLFSSGEIIGIAAYQSSRPNFFQGYRRHLFQLISNLIADVLRDHRSHLRDAKSDRSDEAQQAAVLVVHNLNTPVGTIRNSVKLIKHALGTLESSSEAMARILGDLEMIDKQCQRLGGIRRRFAELFVGGDDECQEVSVRRLVEGVVSEMRFGDKGVDVDLCFVYQDGCVVTYPRKLEIAIEVLLANASDALCGYAGAKKVRVVVRHANDSPVERELDLPCLAIDVIDSGPGVSEEVRKHLFHIRRSKKQGGLGIGLAIARATLQSVGGDVHLGTSESGETRFSLLIPAWRSHTQEGGIQ